MAPNSTLDLAQLQISWVPRDEPLEPLAVVAPNAACALLLGRRLLDRGQEDLQTLRCTVAEGMLIVVGSADSLPWAEGVTYLGKTSTESVLLSPTNVMPNVPFPLFERSILRHCSKLRAPLAVLPYSKVVFSLGLTVELDAAKLAQWLETLR